MAAPPMPIVAVSRLDGHGGLDEMRIFHRGG